MQQVQRVPGPLGLRCDKCGSPAIDQISYEKFFSRNRYACKWCNKEMDLFVMLAVSMLEEVWPAESFHLVGAQSSIFTITLIPDRFYHLDFRDHGIPQDSLILQVNYTPSGTGGLFPVEFHGNQRQVERFLSPRVALYPAPLGVDDKSQCKPTPVNVLVTWIDQSNVDHSASNLFDAFYFFHQGALEKCIIPANVTVEDPLNRLCLKWLSSVAGNKRTKGFLETAATYSHQLNIMLPLLAQHIGAPPLKDAIRGKLNRLRVLRNSLAHGGQVSAQLTRDEVAQLIAASLLGYLYVFWIGQLLDSGNATNQTGH